MKLIKASEQNLITMMAWFGDQESVTDWGGPHFRYPVTQETFLSDVKLDELESYSLVDNDDNLIAFGQYYLRVGHCHLGRLVVAPKHRGQGIGKQLINLLMKKGCTELAVSESSLFVYKHNEYAIAVYQALGFIEATYPEPMAFENGLYMVKPIQQASA